MKLGIRYTYIQKPYAFIEQETFIEKDKYVLSRFCKPLRKPNQRQLTNCCCSSSYSPSLSNLVLHHLRKCEAKTNVILCDTIRFPCFDSFELSHLISTSLVLRLLNNNSE